MAKNFSGRSAWAVAVTAWLLAACGGGGGGGSGASTPPPVVKVPDPVVAPKASTAVAIVDEFIQFDAGPTMTGVSYRWTFSDGSSQDGSQVERRFAAPGSFSAEVVARNSVGVEAKAGVSLVVQAAPQAPARVANQLLPDCSGPHCGVAANGHYAGSEVGVWRYRNDASSARTIDIDIGGVTPAQSVTLVFTNGSGQDAGDLPGAGVAVAESAAHELHAGPAAAGRSAAEDPHTRMLRLNAAQVEEDRRESQRPGATAAEPPRRKAATARVEQGATRVWNDLYGSLSKPVPYTTQAHSICTLASGRRVVFWVDQAMLDAGTITAAHMKPLQDSYCGETGAFARMVGMLGDVWGPAAKAKPWLIQDDTAQPQDVNVAILNVKDSDSWAGYFYGVNNSLRTRSLSYANSNEALVFFVNGPGLARNVTYYVSTLVHELTHMINYYQRWITRTSSHDTWLEETAAMMSEDLLADAITPGTNKITVVRLPSYISSGGGISLLDWADASSADNYNLGGSLAAFLNRRYGKLVAQQLVTECSSGAAALSSLNCLDAVVKKSGGLGFADEWERVGVTAFGGMPARHAPWGYGYRRVDGPAQTLAAADTISAAGARGAGTLATQTKFGKGSHNYLIDQVAAGGSRYQRRGVLVPAGSTLSVVVR